MIWFGGWTRLWTSIKYQLFYDVIAGYKGFVPPNQCEELRVWVKTLGTFLVDWASQIPIEMGMGTKKIKSCSLHLQRPFFKCVGSIMYIHNPKWRDMKSRVGFSDPGIKMTSASSSADFFLQAFAGWTWFFFFVKSVNTSLRTLFETVNSF